MNINVLSILYKNKKLNYLNLVFLVSLALTLLIAFGIMGRSAAFLILGLIIGFILVFPLKQGVNLFLRSIPFFIALPITENFDNFNTWRIVLAVLFLKWLLTESDWLHKLLHKFDWEHIKKFIKENRIEALGILFFVVSFVSLFLAQDYIDGIKRIIYLLNAVLLFIIVKDLIKKDKDNFLSFTKNFAYSGILAVAIGYIQFVSAYAVPAWIFHYWWGQVFSLGMYGKEWASIVTNFGNTWFSYSGATLRLRMFSTFPDSHSFPMYIIMTLPSIFILGFSKLKSLTGFRGASRVWHWNSMSTNFFVGLALIMLALILTGTRGIWLAILPTMLIIPIFKWAKISKKLVTVILMLSLLFISMAPIYFGIVSFRQFQDTEFSTDASLARFRSLIDFGETSNSGRIYIWRETLRSIQKNPLLGVGIGNFPVILDESQTAARAGSSAHNIYLHIASTIGIFGLAAFLWVLWDLFIKSIRYLKKNGTSLYSLYIAIAVFSLTWIFAYLMTDAALYDGRALLAFMVVLGTMVPIKKVPA